jgi:hypothetical protein
MRDARPDVGRVGLLGIDNATFQRRWEADRRARIAGMRAATAQSARGTDVTGDELKQLIAGKTHESVYESTPSGSIGATSNAATSSRTGASSTRTRCGPGIPVAGTAHAGASTAGGCAS